MEIIPYQFDLRRLKEFIDLRDKLYCLEDKNFLPSAKQLIWSLSPDWDFFNKNDDRHRHFIAIVNGEITGHVSAIINPELTDIGEGNEVSGLIGFFECIPDQDSADALLNAAIDWLRKYKITRVLGPMQFDIWHGYRFMTGGFEQDRFPGEPVNPDYYPKLFENFGFIPYKQWHSYRISGEEDVTAIIDPLEPYYHNLIDSGYRFTPLKLHLDPRHAMDLYEIITAACERFPAFTRLSFRSFEKLIIDPLTRLDHRYSTLVYDRDERLLGFSILYPCPTQHLQSSESAHFNDEPHPPEHTIVSFMHGITREETRKASGLGRAIVYHGVHQCLRDGYQNFIPALIADGNPSRSVLGKYAGNAVRQYTLYELRL